MASPLADCPPAIFRGREPLRMVVSCSSVKGTAGLDLDEAGFGTKQLAEL